MIAFHPLADLFPLIEGQEFEDLVADVRANDVRERISIYQGKILDGRNRYRAGIAAGLIEQDDGADREKYFARFVPDVDGDPLKFVISRNLRRRHLDDRQRTSIAGKIANLPRGRPSESGENPPIGGISTEEAASTLNVAPRQVERARVVHAQGAPELREAFDRGDVPVSVAEQIARLPMVEQPQAVRRFLPNGHRAIMGSRIEPDDSLDYFPTPPWAARALCEHVIPALGIAKLDKIWEPACNEGHMAEALAEYAPVAASDIHEYGYGDAGVDFLTCDGDDLADWIITNPPFKDKTEAFVLHALKVARVGVAMFVRMQWLETIGRYERIFRDTPPTMVAFFSERVPLCKGEWKPDGDTATAYIWLVWLRGRAPQAPFWIPPDCRETCARADDEVRFTTHPVTKKEHVYCDEPFDASSGEIGEVRAEAKPEIEFAPIIACCDRDKLVGARAEAEESDTDDKLEIPDFLRRPIETETGKVV